MINIVYPEQRIQIWFGAVASLFVYVVFLQTMPFNSALLNTVQAAALLQLLLTYLSAFVFFDDGGAAEDESGESRAHADTRERNRP